MICLEKECPFARIHALVALGLVRARRGDPDAWAPLDEALRLAESRSELQWIGPVATARAEAAWLEGRHDDIAAVLTPALGFPMRRGDPYATSLIHWRRRAGGDVEIPPTTAMTRWCWRWPATGRSPRSLGGDRMSLRSSGRTHRRRRRISAATGVG